MVLLYHLLADLQITVLSPGTLMLAGGVLAAGLLLGLAAAFSREPVRILVLSLTAVVWLDLVFPLPALFDPLVPERRAVAGRDATRLEDIATIQRALETHVKAYGRLPRPRDYGEGMGPANFWNGWWDVSAEDGDEDGVPFLDFLVERGILLSVPVDPRNEASGDGHPGGGSQYVYFVVPAGYVYEGGQCEAHQGRSTYMLAITDLELEESRPASSGCECLWRDKPDFFQQYFDYLVCGQAPR